mmetsp:Transcript_8000/g.12679  ORF Transcript_8000/g.12679 Transcript_8000/m.12679 type:complete len:80 (-) Transcript_8000:171-410(-)
MTAGTFHRGLNFELWFDLSFGSEKARSSPGFPLRLLGLNIELPTSGNFNLAEASGRALGSRRWCAEESEGFRSWMRASA